MGITTTPALAFKASLAIDITGTPLSTTGKFARIRSGQTAPTAPPFGLHFGRRCVRVSDERRPVGEYGVSAHTYRRVVGRLSCLCGRRQHN